MTGTSQPMKGQRNQRLPHLDNPKHILSEVLMASGLNRGELTDLWRTITQGEARFAIKQLWLEAAGGADDLSARLKRVVEQSQGDFNADPGLLHILTKLLDGAQLTTLAETVHQTLPYRASKPKG